MKKRFNPNEWKYVTKHLTPMGKDMLKSIKDTDQKEGFLAGFRATNGIPMSKQHANEEIKAVDAIWERICERHEEEGA